MAMTGAISPSLHQLARDGNIEEATKIITDENVVEKDKHQRTALHLAVWAKKLDFVKFLLSHKNCDVHAEAADQTTALHFAAQGGNLEIVEILIKHGAKVNSRAGKIQKTPLMMAASKGHLDIVKYLIEKGADACSKASNGQTASDMTMDQDIRKAVDNAIDVQKTQQSADLSSAFEESNNGEIKKRPSHALPEKTLDDTALKAAKIVKKPKISLLSFQEDVENDE